MELKEYISRTLLEIVEGVKTAQDQAVNYGSFINPTGLAFDSRQINGRPYDFEESNISQIIDFDIAVTVQEESRDKACIGVLTGILGGKLQGESGEHNVLSHRIRFSVPILFPGCEARPRKEQGIEFAKHDYDPFKK